MTSITARLFWLMLTGGLLSLAILWTLQVIALFRWWRLRQAPASCGCYLPAVSILKPLKGADSELFTNLEALVLQDYPTFEVLFGVQNSRDPAVTVVRRLQRAYPNVDIRLVFGTSNEGLNPKVNNLLNISRFARFAHLLISDADVRPPKDYLRRLASELQNGAALVHNVLIGTKERRLGAVMESLHMNAFVAATLLGSEVVRHSCVVGKSMLFERRHLASVGGFEGVKNLLAEDYVLGRRFRHAGLRVALSSTPLPVALPDRDIQSFFKRHLRWAQMRRRVSLGVYLGEAVGNPVAWFAAWLPLALFSPPAGEARHWLGLALLAVGLKCSMDVVMMRAVSGGFEQLKNVFWIPVKDLLVCAAWWVGLFDRKINWRGNYLRIGPQSRLYACQPSPFQNDDQDVVEGVHA